MRKDLTLFALFFIATFVASAQVSKTVTLKIDSCNGKDATIGDCGPCGYPNSNFGDHPDFIAASWTNGGNLSNARGLMDFNLAGIPANATITNAKLSLYHSTNTPSGNIGHGQNGGPNTAWLRRITTAWGENTVTWNTQPTTTTQNQVTLAASTSTTQNYLNIDVTALVQDMVNNPQQSFGFFFQLQEETPLRSMLFASSDHPNSLLHPTLEITYLDNSPSTCISLKPDNSSCNPGVDATIGDCGPCGYPNSNFGDHPDFIAASWTNGGNLSNARGLLNFDLTSIPANATITSAALSLYHSTSTPSGNIGHGQNGGSNAAWLRRVTSAWGEYTVTWNNQPTTTTQNQVTLAASTSTTQNYLNIDVAALVQDMVSNPQQSFGFMLQLQTESPLRSMLFASSDHPNAALHPKLDVCYTVSTGIENARVANAILAVYPNPSNGVFTISLTENIENGTVRLFNVAGEIVLEEPMNGKTKTINAQLSKGFYFVQVNANGNRYTTKLVNN
ncbi:MAG: DNRLRE domain-containing protein [Chitinophagales bacterium]|nr:DNRLRE domain-containing protein [Chitinophagales bacterium]